MATFAQKRSDAKKKRFLGPPLNLSAIFYFDSQEGEFLDADVKLLRLVPSAVFV